MDWTDWTGRTGLDWILPSGANNLYLECREESFAVLKPPVDVEGEHPRVAELLLLRQLVLRVAGKAWAPQNLVA